MPKKKKTVADDREAPLEEDMTSDEELADELANEEVADEEAAMDTEMAAETAKKEAEANSNMVMLTVDDIPEIENMDTGDTITVTAELTMQKKNDDGTADFQLTDVVSAEQEAEMEQTSESASAPAAPAAPTLGGMLGGAGGTPPPAA